MGLIIGGKKGEKTFITTGKDAGKVVTCKGLFTYYDDEDCEEIKVQSPNSNKRKVTTCDGMFTYYEDENDKEERKTKLIEEIKSVVNTNVSEEEKIKLQKMAEEMISDLQNDTKNNANDHISFDNIKVEPVSSTKNDTSGSLLDTAGNVLSETLGFAAGVVGLAASGVAVASKAAIDGASNLYDTTKNDIQMFNDDKAKNEKNQKRLSDAQQLYVDSYHILEYEAKQLDDLIKRLKSQVSRLTEYYSKDTSSLSIAQNKITTADETNISASFAGAMGAGTLAAGSTLGLVAAFGTAGTGAAISSLSGTYAASATLAWLGGGTLASGGAGIAGGVAVSAALFAVPALAVGGVLAHNKVQEFHEKVKKATAAVDKAININKKLTARNYEAAERIRTISEVGIAIMFFLRDLNYRQQYVKGDNLVKMKQISGAAKEKLFETYLQIKPLDDKNNAENHIMDTLEAIEDECADLQRILDYDDVTLYNSRTFEDAFHKIFEDAKEYVWISYLDYRNWCIDRDIKYMRSAIKRGVKLVVFYGLKGDTSNPRYKSNSDKKAKLNSDAIQYLKEQLNSQNVTIIPSDSHRKIALCEKYVLHGSHNIMSYRWKPEDQREEVTAKLNGEKTVLKFKDLLRGLSRKDSVFTADI